MERWLNITITCGVLMTIGLTIYTVYRILVKKSFSGYSKESKEYNALSRKIMDIILAIIMILILAVGFRNFLIPYILDARYIWTKEYPILQGEIDSVVHKDMGEEVIIEGNEAIVVITDRALEEGDTITIRYLPHFKTGEIVD